MKRKNVQEKRRENVEAWKRARCTTTHETKTGTTKRERNMRHFISFLPFYFLHVCYKHEHLFLIGWCVRGPVLSILICNKKKRIPVTQSKRSTHCRDHFHWYVYDNINTFITFLSFPCSNPKWKKCHPKWNLEFDHQKDF